MKKSFATILWAISLICIFSCSRQSNTSLKITAKEILGNPDYPALSYGGYREKSRDSVPTVDEIKDDMKILSAMGIKILRTYRTTKYDHAANVLKAIRALKNENADFEMYVMLGTWIECEGAWTDTANHYAGDVKNNTVEIEAAVEMANTYPDIVKVIAVGNEAMVQWAITYFVTPNVILEWVNYLQELKKTGDIPADIWITSSDNYESWGGGAKNYHTDDLVALIHAVDYVSMHTYPFHDSHYNPSFWGVPADEENLSKLEKIDAAMVRAKEYAISQYQNVADYMAGLGIEKDIHIGETGWATVDGSAFSANGSKAADEYKEKRYYEWMREWSGEKEISCFFFEAFDEKWKDSMSELGSENHFGLIKHNGQVKYVLWDMVDEGLFEGLTRNGLPITKTYGGDKNALMEDVFVPPLSSKLGILEINTTNKLRESGEKVTEEKFVITNPSLVPDESNNSTYPSSVLKLNSWEGTCHIKMSGDHVIVIATGSGAWWGCGIEMKSGTGEDLSNFEKGYLIFDIKGNTTSTFNLGFQTGSFAKGNQVNNYVTFGSNKDYAISEEWKTWSIPMSVINKGGDLSDVTVPVFFLGEGAFDGLSFQIRNIYYSQK